MKKILTLISISTLGLSCLSDGLRKEPTEPVMLTISVDNVTRAADSDHGAGDDNAGELERSTRKITTPAVADKTIMILDNGHIFIIDNTGTNVLDHEPLTDESIAAGGQSFPRQVPRNALVMVVGNLPEGFDPEAISTLDDIRAIHADVTALDDYKRVPLRSGTTQISLRAVNTDGAPAEGIVRIALVPAVAVLELTSVTGINFGGKWLKSFTLTDVYLNNYWPHYTFGGQGWSENGQVVVQNPSNPQAPGHTGVWPGVQLNAEDPKTLTAYADNADGSQCWQFIVAGGQPGFLLRVENLETDKAVIPEPGFIKVSCGNATLAAGYVYRAAAKIDPTKVPNPPDNPNAEVEVLFEVAAWQIHPGSGMNWGSSKW